MIRIKNEGIGTAAMNLAIASVESPGLYCGMQNLMEPEQRHIGNNNAWTELLILKILLKSALWQIKQGES